MQGGWVEIDRLSEAERLNRTPKSDKPPSHILRAMERFMKNLYGG
jgi:hypothetical protein